MADIPTGEAEGEKAQMNAINFLNALMGRSVIIEWMDHINDTWRHFRFCGVGGTDGNEWVALQGEVDSTGARYLGGMIFVRLEEIRMIELTLPAKRETIQ